MTSEVERIPQRKKSLEEIHLKDVVTVLSLSERFRLRNRSDKYKQAVDYSLQSEVNIWIAEESKLMDRKKQINGRVEDITVNFIKSTFPNLAHIGLGCSVDITIFIELIRHCSNLKMLTLDGQHFNDKHINALIEYSNITNIRLRSCMITEDGLNSLVSEYSQLKSLAMEQINTIEGKCLNNLKDNFTTLQVINCKKINSETWKAVISGKAQCMDMLMVHNCHFSTNDLLTLSKRMQKLSHLDFRFPLGVEISLDFNIISSFIGLKVLKIIDESNCPSFTEKHFSVITRSCSQLNSIQLHFKQNAKINFKKDTFNDLPETCAAIQSLSFAGFEDISTQFKRCKQLKEIKFANMLSSDKMFQNILQETNLTKVTFVNCRNIGTLTLTETCKLSHRSSKEWVYLTTINSGIHKKFSNDYFRGKKCPKNLIIIHDL